MPIRIHLLVCAIALALANIGCRPSNSEISSATIGSTSASPQLSAAMSNNEIAFQDGVLVVFGVKHEFPLLLADLESTLGPPDRVTELQNRIVTWDQHGLMAYEKKQGDPIRSIVICFAKGEHAFSPSSVFDGVLNYGAASLSKESSRQDLVAAGLKQDELLPFLHVHEATDFDILAEYRDGLREFSINVVPDVEDFETEPTGETQ